MASNAVFIHHPGSHGYKFGEEHPFNPLRLTLTIDLLKAAGAISDEQIEHPLAALDDDRLTLVHRTDYVDAVKRLSADDKPEEADSIASSFGLNTEDTPYFAGMHQAAAAIVSGSVAAADAVMTGKAAHAYHLAGGLHHAFPDRASGFCVYNDAAVAIKHIRQTYQARVLYVDTDVHHGDGVQWVFYDDPDVCTYSIHETGKYLFPGTGFVHEKGMDRGLGACFNMPLEPYTEDDSWLESFNATLRKIIAAFKPDVIISQHGCDAHAFDPLSHMQCSMRIYAEIPAILHELAHTYTNGRWIAIGGGGYDLFRVVPRAWSLVWLTMIDHPIAAEAAAGRDRPLPDEWLKQWAPSCPQGLPSGWLDNVSSFDPMPRRAEIAVKNRAVQAVVIQDL
ncbi:acetoin utilization protein AcuC [Paenibacillus arenilitoris]|uniref:Acetoin utilization protein AcuC n=1 Tax=Paenibacillus arenilitoris TaxID=2772299 RepID=A0A927CSM6_9BACL|nr:acetoin utilization protein AcuC [Paenibacillus arenilitoris]MBD2871491.1 acetoin utilization protein AcuC [Paenibacillus arenilitoris]